jgi:hypothetical protein
MNLHPVPLTPLDPMGACMRAFLLHENRPGVILNTVYDEAP